jgi:predicted DNA-binding transcriptional regulator YafY
VKIPVAHQEILIKRILGQKGRLVVVEPEELKAKVREAALSVIEAHQS